MIIVIIMITIMIYDAKVYCTADIFLVTKTISCLRNEADEENVVETELQASSKSSILLQNDMHIDAYYNCLHKVSE